ncbi:MAG: DUF6512 family protein [Bacilli bacterium]
MTLKRLKVIDVFIIFALCFLTHFIYSWFPNTLFSIFFPVNESIWEHMKMLFSAIIIFSVVDFILLKVFEIKYRNFITSIFLSAVLSIIIFLAIYLPLYYFIGENMVLNLTVLFVSIVFSQAVSYFVLESKDYGLLNYVSLIGIIFSYIVFGILTYYPPTEDLFYDPMDEKFGINTYNV